MSVRDPSGFGDPFQKKGQRLFHPLKQTRLFFALAAVSLLFAYSFVHKNFSYQIWGKIQDFLAFFYRPVNLTKESVNRLTLLKRTKEDLAREISELKMTLRNYEHIFFDYENVKEENAYLKSLLPLVQSLDLRKTITTLQRPLPAQPFVSMADLPKKTLEKIDVGDAVIAPYGLFGQVVFKDDRGINILLVTHIQSRIPVVSTQSHKKAILFGQNNSYFKIKYVMSEVLEDFQQDAPFKVRQVLSSSNDAEALLDPLSSESLPREKEEGGAVDEEVDKDRVAGGVINANRKKTDDFIDGEILTTSDEAGFFVKSIPVARIIRDAKGQQQAEWLGESYKDIFVTVVTRK